MRTLERPELARVLATVTDRPVGHWIAELRSPAFRAGWEIETYGGPRLCWLVAREFGRNTTDCRSAPLAITDPAEALETLCQRGVLPPSFVGDVSRWFFCAKCARVGWQCDAPVACVCKGRGEVPATLADLLAWASLGAETIARAEHLARTTAERLRPWGVRPPVETATTPDGHAVSHERPWRVVWRVNRNQPRSQRRGAVEVEIVRLPRCNVYRTGEIWRRDRPGRDIYYEGDQCLSLKALWDEGVAALDQIHDDVLTLVCPPLDESP